MDEAVKYPKITVKLTGGSGNAFMIVGKMRRELRIGLENTYKLSRDEANSLVIAFTTEATSGDYDKVLQTCMKWVTVK